jgi:ERF superfamily
MPTPAAEQRSLHTKLSEVMAALGRVPKNGNGPGYKYAAAADVADAVRDLFAARHITMMPVKMEPLTPPDATTLSGKQAILTLLVTWRLSDGDSGETVEFQTVGTGADTTDKAAGKAQTGAQKYAALMSLTMATGDDPEAAAEEPHGRAAPRQTTRQPTQGVVAQDLAGADARAANAKPSRKPAGPELPLEELEGIRDLLAEIIGAPTPGDLASVGRKVAADADLNAGQVTYLRAAYKGRVAEFEAERETGTDAAA